MVAMALSRRCCLALAPLAVLLISAGVPAQAEPQLFVNDALVDSQRGLTRKLHPARTLESAVIEPDQPWEGKRALVYGTVLHDPERGLFRMWYHGRIDDPKAHECPGLTRPDLVLYAESRDGVSWIKPKLGLFAFDGSKENNIVFLNLHCPSVVRDPAAEKEQRFKLVGSRSVRGGFHGAVSADGIHWKSTGNKAIIPFGSELASLSQDPVSRQFYAFFRTAPPSVRPEGMKGQRTLSMTTSGDFHAWSEPRLILSPDARDNSWTERPEQRSELHDLSAWRRGSHWLGLVGDFRITAVLDKPGHGQAQYDGPVDVQLVHSRDGQTWERHADRTPVIPLGPKGRFDAGCILGKANIPVFHGDEMWIYYTGMNRTLAATQEEKRLAIGRAAWRLDGLVSLDAGDQGGELTTHPQTIQGELTVNADAARGSVEVELLGAAGAVLARSEPLTTDSVRHTIRWRDGKSPPAGRARLRFTLRSASLYSFNPGSPR